MAYMACGSTGEYPDGAGGSHDSNSGDGDAQGDGDGDGDDTLDSDTTTDGPTTATSAGSTDSGDGGGDTEDTDAGGAGEPSTGSAQSAGGAHAGGNGAGTGGDGSGGKPPVCDDVVTVFEGTDVSNAVIAEEGQYCDTWGALACGGADDKRALYCDQGQWMVLTECDDDQSCDRLTGVCTEIFEGCESKQPGDTFCDDDLMQECGPDRVNLTSSTACCGVCTEGSCQEPFCGDGKINLEEECDDGNDVLADGCEPDCKTSGLIALTAGEHHTCALLVGGHVRCWGGNESGQLGQAHTNFLGDQHPFQIPVVELGGPAVGIDAGRNHTCALMADGSVQCWGKNEIGQLGLGHTRSIGDGEHPTAAVSKVQLGAKAITVSAGGENSCALLEDQTLRCWGRNNHGQLGLGNTDTIGDSESPSKAKAEVPLGEAATDVAVGGGEHICAIPEGGGIKCWGNDLTVYPAEDIGDDEPASEAILYKYGPTTGLVAGGPRACGVVTGEGNHCLGYDGDGALAVGVADEFGSVLYTWGRSQVWQVAMGSQHTCVSLSDYTLRCFGYNDKAQLGIDNTAFAYAGVGLSLSVDLGENNQGNPSYALLIAGGDQFTCALTELGELRCWGRNDQGQLGLGYVSPGPLDYVGGTEESVPGNRPPVRLFP